ncbi:gelsolin domain-containing protein [Tanacetum coccineum]
MASTRASISKASKRPKINIIPPKQLFVDLTQNDTKTLSPKHQLPSPSAPNAPSKIPSTKNSSSSSIDYIPTSPTSSTSPSTNGYLNSPTSPPLRVPPPPPNQESGLTDITLTLSPITPLDLCVNSRLVDDHYSIDSIVMNLSKEFVDIVKETLEFGVSGCGVVAEKDEVCTCYDHMKEQQSVKELIDVEPEPNQDVKPVITQGEDQVVARGMATWFDHETAAAVMARLAGHETQKNFPREVVRWLDKELISFASKFGDYIPEDPSSFRLSTNFSLYPQFMYHLRRSQVIDVFNSSPDKTAFFQLMLNREGVVGHYTVFYQNLFRYSFDGPPIPVLLDVCSLSPDVILLFDSYFYIVIHYGSKTSQWKKMGYDRDPNHECFRKLLEAPAIEAEQLVA